MEKTYTRQQIINALLKTFAIPPQEVNDTKVEVKLDESHPMVEDFLNNLDKQ